MRSLFLKIFLWFWGAMIAIGLTLFLVVTTTRPDPLPEPWRDSTSAAISAYASGAVTAWEQQGKAGLQAYLNEQEAKTDYRLNLCDDNQVELSGRPLDQPFGPFGGPPGERGGKGPLGKGRRPRPPFDDGPPPGRSPFELPFFGNAPGPGRPDDWQKLHRLALESDEPIFELAGPRVLVAQSISSSQGRRYVMQAVVPRPRFGRPAADARSQALGVLTVLAMSGLVCFGLVRYLTAPMVALRQATQQLAAGDLSARTGAGKRARRDEVADLGRDFDTMAERIEALVVSQRRLLGDISHELRSPLARLSMALALGRRHVAQGASAEEVNGAFDRIKRETVRINTLIEQLLQLARLDSGEVEEDRQRLDLALVLAEVVADADYEAKEKERGVRLLSRASCHLDGSVSLITSAFENVIRNAIRYTAPRTTVQVSFACEETGDEDTAVVTVRDYGPGVPEEALEKLFRPFYRVADARDRETGGVGLGLAITERAIHSHGGTVSARNAADGGLIVEMRLPVIAAID